MNSDTSIDTWQGRSLGAELRWFRLPKDILPADFDVLSAEERARSADFTAARRRLEYVASRARLRRSLGEALHVAPSVIPISPDAFGKPQHSGDVQFNLSHSAGAVLIAWGDRPIGVDLEAAKRATQHIGRLRIVADVRDAMSIELIAAFTLVEATTKALGRGLAAVRGLRIGSVAASGEIRFTSPGRQRPIRAIAVDVPDGYVGAVAVLD